VGFRGGEKALLLSGGGIETYFVVGDSIFRQRVTKMRQKPILAFLMLAALVIPATASNVGEFDEVDGLIFALSIPSKYQMTAAKLLGEIGDPRAVDPLIDALQDEDWQVRAEAATALGKIGDAKAIGPLIVALGDYETPILPSERVRQAAAKALVEFGEPAVNPLIYAFVDKSGWVRSGAVEVLGEIGEPAIDPLIETLKSKEYGWGYRSNAAKALGEIGDLRAFDPLIDALQDEYSGVRKEAATALGKIGDPRAVEPLIESLGDKDLGVRESAAQALGKIGDPRAVDPLIDALQDEYSGVRKEAIAALGEIGDPKAVDPLIEFLKFDPIKPVSEIDQQTRVVRSPPAMQATFGEPIPKPRDEEWGTRGTAAWALGRIGDTRAVEPLIDALKDEHEYVRMYAARALGWIGDVRAVDALTYVASMDEDNRVREAAAEALEKIRAGR